MRLIRDSSVIFVTLLLTLYVLQPTWLFEEHSGKRREFGIGYTHDREKRTLFDIKFVVVILSIFSFVIAKKLQ